MNSDESVRPDNRKKNDFFSFRLRLWGLLTAAGAIAAAASAAGFWGQFAWWLDIGSHFRVQYALGFAALALCYFVGGKKRWAVAALCVCLLNAAPIVAFLLPPARVPASHEDALRAILVNVNTQTGDPLKIISLIERENPDIVVLEEIDDEWVKSLGPLIEKYALRMIEPRQDNFGIALLSRGETKSAKVEFFGSAKVPSIVATVLLNNRPLTLIATHPLPPAGPLYSALRNEQLEQLGRSIRTLDGPVLLLGDLNVTPWSYYYRAFIRTSGLINSSRGRGIYPTWPTFAPPLSVPIDYALHTDDLVTLQKRVGPNVGSDHYPLLIDFAFRELEKE